MIALNDGIDSLDCFLGGMSNGGINPPDPCRVDLERVIDDVRERVLVGVTLPLLLIMLELPPDVLIVVFGGALASRLTRER